MSVTSSQHQNFVQQQSSSQRLAFCALIELTVLSALQICLHSSVGLSRYYRIKQTTDKDMAVAAAMARTLCLRSPQEPAQAKGALLHCLITMWYSQAVQFKAHQISPMKSPISCSLTKPAVDELSSEMPWLHAEAKPQCTRTVVDQDSDLQNGTSVHCPGPLHALHVPVAGICPSRDGQVRRCPGRRKMPERTAENKLKATDGKA